MTHPHEFKWRKMGDDGWCSICYLLICQSTSCQAYVQIRAYFLWNLAVDNFQPFDEHVKRYKQNNFMAETNYFYLAPL